MIDEKRFSGVLNLDDSDTLIMPEQHKDARNLRFYGTQQGFIAEGIMGTVEVSFTKPAGTNQCIGAHYDQLRRRIYFFNWNSNTRHGIYYYDMRTGTVTKLFLCFTDSATDILAFSRNYPVHSCAIVYRTDADGNLLYWTDGLNPPKYINVATVATLTPFTIDMLYAAKMPPLIPATVAYSSDATKFYNSVNNRYFRFAYRWVYASLEKSTFSPVSIVPQPTGITNPETNVAPNANNLITVAVRTGSTADFSHVEILGQEFNGTIWGDFFLIQSISKANAGGLSATYTFSFFNDGIYSSIAPGESDLRFDYLPDLANTLELLNGNTLIYGGITEGYDKLTRSDINVQVTTSLTALPSLAVTKAWKWANNERLGLIYFDKRGKTNGVISFLDDASIDSTNFDITTPAYPGTTIGVSSTVPTISASINHLPPSWAVTYQWVRIDAAPPFFLQYLTNDYQVDSDFIYLGIEGIIYNNTKSGFLPSYEFTEGDRVRVMGTMSFAGGALTAFSTQYDFQILSVVQKDMMGLYNPPEKGAFLKCKKPVSFPTPAYTQFMVMEIYTPPKNVNESNAIFYEWGQEYAITGGYHMGQTQNQTVSLPATFAWTNGYVYSKYRSIFATTGLNLATLNTCMDRRYNDFQDSQANDNSRGWVIDDNIKQEYYPATVRWGGSYIQDTNINNLNRFLSQDLDTVDRGKGDIRRLKARDRILRVFQDRGVGQYGIYARYIQNNEGNPELITTDSIITTNNINYYQGEYGLGGYPTSLVCASNTDYFSDPVRGDQIRLSGDGITVVSDIYKGQFTIKGYLTPYNRALLRSDGSNAKIMGYYDYFENQYHCILQAGTDGVETTTAKNFSFNEQRNGYASFYDFNPEWAIGAEDITFSFVDGALYIHNNTGAYCTFYGTTYPAYITVVFNKNLLEKKTFLSVTEVANTTWICPSIYTNSYSYNTQRQDSNLIVEDFTTFEGQPSASFRRDVNSIGGIIVGDTLKGSLLVVKFQVASPTSLVTLSSVTVTSIDSPLTSK